MFFSISTLFAVLTRSTVAGVIATLAFWFLCLGVNYARQAAATAGPVGLALESAYWLLPKPADLGILLIDALGAQSSFSQDSVLEAVRTSGEIRPELTLLSSFLVPFVAIVAAVRRLNRNEY